MASSLVPWHEYSGSDTEALIAALLARTIPGAQRIDGSGGDDGVDVRVQIGNGYHIYQIKSFYKRLTSSQKRQIAESLVKAVERQSAIVRWTLVLPLDLSPGEDRWFTGALAAKSGAPIDWIGRTQLEERLSQHRDLLRAFAPGSTERRAMDLLGEYNAEKAALTRGMVDGIERLASLKSQIDLTDPDWAFDFEVAGENVNVQLRPKDSEAVRRRPIGIAVGISANDAVVTQQVEQFMRYGRPVKIPGESILTFEADLPGNLAEMIQQTGKPSLSLQKSDEEKAWRLAQRVEAIRDGRVIGTLAINWDDRSQGPLGGSWLSGKDRSGFLELTMRTEPDLKGGIEIRAPASNNVLPEDVVPVLRFLSILRSGDRLRFVATRYPDLEARLTGNPVGDSAMLEAGVIIADALARIQTAVGVRFPLPEGWNAEDGKMIYFWDQLLSKGQVQWYWPGYSVNMSAGQVSKLLAQSVLPRISMSGISAKNPIIELLGYKIPVQGQVRCEVTNMVIPNPRSLAEQIREIPTETPVAVPLAQDDRTISMFYLDHVSEPSGAPG